MDNVDLELRDLLVDPMVFLKELLARFLKEVALKLEWVQSGQMKLNEFLFLQHQRA